MFGRLLGRLLLMPASRETQKAVEKEFRALEPLLLSQLPLAAKNKDMRDRNSYAKRSKKELKGGRKSEILHLQKSKIKNQKILHTKR